MIAVAVDLPTPVGDPTLRVTVPKITVHDHGQALVRECQIRRPGGVGVLRVEAQSSKTKRIG
jgi:hypothetical protein